MYMFRENTKFAVVNNFFEISINIKFITIHKNFITKY
jgi:hypothetical protein